MSEVKRANIKVFSRVLFWLILIVLLWGAVSISYCQTPRWRDRDSIVTALDREWLAHTDSGPPRSVIAAALAIAWEESAGNDSTPGLRGHRCWYTIPRRVERTYIGNMWIMDTVPRRIHHEKDCEVGRFQIKPSTARLRCPGWNVFTDGGNRACFAQMFYEDVAKGGTLYAIKRQNGKGDLADAYLKRVLATIGWMTITGSPT